tara:strand:- start:202 stop:576 length:375 start_codon:yes stop_codon:yes gene_type:complete
MSKSTVFISGEGIGIGKGMAEAFAEARYRVIVTDVLVDEGTRVVSALTGSGADAEFHEMNVTDTDQVNTVIAGVEESYGPITTLVCNAGIAKNNSTKRDDRRSVGSHNRFRPKRHDAFSLYSAA